MILRIVVPTLLALLGACDPDGGPPATDAPAPSYDLLISGGHLVDGSGAPSRRADLLLAEGRIAHIGPVDPDTLQVTSRFDASGLVVAPGFIDAHAHGDPVEAPGFPNFLAMGVTTIVMGQDGGSPEAGALAGHLDAVDAASPGVNVAYLVGHNTLRSEAGVGHDPPTPDGSARIAELVARGMDAGAFGLSTGLEYSPGLRADVDELAVIAGPVAERDGVVMSHMRNEDADAVEASLGELLEQGRRSGAAVHASHLKVVLGDDPAQARRLLEAMDRAREEGRRVSADVYPYTASFTGISILFPDWARPPSDYGQVLADRRDPLLEHLRMRVESRNGPGATLFGSGELDGFGRLAGHTLEEVADRTGRRYPEILAELGPGGARAAYFVMDDEVMATLLADPWVAVSSDGSPTMLHPRGYGSFARVLRRFVAEEGRLELEEAVRKMSSLTATVVGLDDPGRVDVPRGRLEEGWAADLVAFDPSTVRDPADFEEPHQLAEGMRRVWVNGAEAWRDGEPSTEPGAGRALRARWNR